jgi:hypothetical protein
MKPKSEEVLVECILETGYNDKETNEFIPKGKQYSVSQARAKELEEKGAVKFVTIKNVREQTDDLYSIAKRRRI